MSIAKVTNDYDNITSSNYTDYDNITSNNCTNKDHNVEIILPLITIIPSVLSFIFLISLMVYIIIKPSFNKKNNIINGQNFIPNSSCLLCYNRTK